MEKSTAAIHVGTVEDASRSVAMPLVLSTTFERGDDGLSFPGSYIYSRDDTPNRRALEQKLAVLEGGVECVTFASGLASVMAYIHRLIVCCGNHHTGAN